jgi:alpha-L-fucosidase
MAIFDDEATRPAAYRRFERETPQWYQDAKLGIFTHWGPYSVPAWAEPIGPLGTFDSVYWMTHNPYAEWYYNTSKIDGSPAQQHQQEVYGGADYDAFIDQWQAENFDADAFMKVVAATGARYFVPTTKHHDGVTLWDAPGTGERNTVRRGPHRDLVQEFHDAALRQGIRFGVYYSGGLDWWFSGLSPITGEIGQDLRPNDKAYADYAFDQTLDLIERYQPSVLWGDIDWPDAGKEPGDKSLIELFDRYYAAVPDGVVNDRFGTTHWDFKTSEYEAGRSAEGERMWENTRGIGFSFGHNQLEDESNSLDGPGVIKHFVDVVSRGGNLLLNIGPTAAGEITEIQRRTLAGLGAWNTAHGDGIFGSRTLPVEIARPSDEPWVRWTRSGDRAHAFVDLSGGSVTLDLEPDRLDIADATAGTGAELQVKDGRVRVDAVGEVVPAGPAHLSFRLR